MVKSCDYQDLHRACRQVVSVIDDLKQTEEALDESIYGSANVADRLKSLGIKDEKATHAMRSVLAEIQNAECEVVFTRSIERTEIELNERIERLQSELKGFMVVPESFTAEFVTKIVTDEIFGMEAFSKWLLDCGEFVASGSQKAMLLNLVMGAVAQFKAEVKPEDIRLALPYEKLPMVVMCPVCESAFNSGYDESGKFVTHPYATELSAFVSASGVTNMDIRERAGAPAYSVETWIAERALSDKPSDMPVE